MPYGFLETMRRFAGHDPTAKRDTMGMRSSARRDRKARRMYPSLMILKGPDVSRRRGSLVSGHPDRPVHLTWLHELADRPQRSNASRFGDTALLQWGVPQVSRR